MKLGKLFGNLIQATVRTVALPVSLARDILPLDGYATGNDSVTAENLEKIKEELDDAFDALDEED